MSNKIKNPHPYYTTYVVKNEKEYRKLLKHLEKTDEAIVVIYAQKDGSSKIVTAHCRGRGCGEEGGKFERNSMYGYGFN